MKLDGSGPNILKVKGKVKLEVGNGNKLSSVQNSKKRRNNRYSSLRSESEDNGDDKSSNSTSGSDSDKFSDTDNFVPKPVKSKSQVWYPTLLLMLIEPLIPINNPMLLSPHGEQHPLIMNNTLFLVGWRVSGDPTLQWDFQRKLESLSWKSGTKSD